MFDHHHIVAILPALIPSTVMFWLHMWQRSMPFTTEVFQKEYDYIIVGAGSAGAVVASRLSEDPKVRVLLLEAGGYETFQSEIPMLAARLQLSEWDWQYKTVPQKYACQGMKNHVSNWPRGKVLGGCSTLNYMLYIRGNARDYDLWESLGNPGWGWSDVFYYFVKSEDNRDPDIIKNGYHGTGGRLTVSTPHYTTPIAGAFLEAGKNFGYPNLDLNGPQQTGFAVPQGTIRRGARCSTAKAYLRDTAGRPNLDTVVYAQVTRVLFNADKHAIGVTFDKGGSRHAVYARREVILSAGAIGSPHLLMLSGIGPRDHLESLGIPVVHDSPGVGQNLQDHIGAGGLSFLTDAPVTVVQPRVFVAKSFTQWSTLGIGPLTMLGGLDGLGFINTKYANKSDDWPDVEIHFIPSCPSSDGGESVRKNMNLKDELFLQVYGPNLYKDAYSYYPVLLRPRSVGYMKLRSANPYDHPIIDPKYLSDPYDVAVLVDSLKISTAMALSPAFDKFKPRVWPQAWYGCEKHKPYSDPFFECITRSFTATIYHPVGTAKMGPADDPLAVVDPELRVHGVKRLRVIDGSIMPKIVSGNTNAPIIMIGEKGADLIKGIRGPPPVKPGKVPIPKYLQDNGHGSVNTAAGPLSQIGKLFNKFGVRSLTRRIGLTNWING
ncbi:glucose dehydrogenase [FAD, quinone]-like isoform X1 [Tetranychus urticae]|nr:glucose dehydrogenase [FAD, quinone]-like isoform X1 [Tetranychus urticae]XP_025016429.1 glucose dehydrogenase [FAD, quinone]-like isoform X1 [Tetranychus urticae]XP_025016430.1 glucose dehydrogenase [FAD, quinone]-like isoform X1 [Tetranychus urticae]